MSSKPRPPNASGPNGLRGGIKQFSNKTATGPWLENYGGAQGYKRGFSSADYQTEAQYAQLGATLKTTGYYGAELPDTLEKSLNPFKYEGTQGPDAWKSNTALMGEPVLCRDKVHRSTKVSNCNYFIISVILFHRKKSKEHL